jgi:predicted MFS family arabinose efflux permease
LVDGTKGAAFPLIRADLHLSYPQVGLLIAVPLLVGGLIELPLGILAGYGARRNQLVLAGGVIFGGSLIVVGFAGSFGVLLVGLIAFFPASGAFVSLTQAALMDADPPTDQSRHADRRVACQPEASEPEPDQPEVNQPEAGEPEASQFEVSQPDAGEPEPGQPEAREPEPGQPEAREPEPGQPEAREPEAGEPEGDRPGVDQFEASQFEAGEPEASTPDAGRSEGGRRGREVVQEQRMAAWNLAGSTGAVAGPILLAVVLTAGGSWRWAYLLLAGVTGIAVAIAAVGGPARLASRSSGPAGPASSSPSTEQSGGHGTGPADEEDRDQEDQDQEDQEQEDLGRGREDKDLGRGRGDKDLGRGRGDKDLGRGRGDKDLRRGREDKGEDDDGRPSLREGLGAIRDGNVARWLILLEVTDLLLDVLTGYVGIYLVDVVHASPADAALGVAVRLGAGLAGDALFVVASRRISGRAALTISAAAAAVLYPAFMLVPWFGAKLAVLAALSVATACWYPVVQAGLYGSLPGRSGIAVSWSSAAGMVGAVGPLLVGVVAQQAGLTWALTGLVIVPVAVLMIAPHRAGRRSRSVMR